MSLKIGSKAPLFIGKDENNTTVNLADFLGKKIILYFYPKDNTSSCTKEACSFKNNHSTLIENNFVVIGVSPDDNLSHQNFKNLHQLPFTLIADSNKDIINLYGMWIEKIKDGEVSMTTSRTTFIIDEHGLIINIFNDVNAEFHAEQILERFGIKDKFSKR